MLTIYFPPSYEQLDAAWYMSARRFDLLGIQDGWYGFNPSSYLLRNAVRWTNIIFK